MARRRSSTPTRAASSPARSSRHAAGPRDPDQHGRQGLLADNVFVERLWRTIKYEEVYLHAYDSVSEAKTGVGRYFEFYNERRPHAASTAGPRMTSTSAAAACGGRLKTAGTSFKKQSNLSNCAKNLSLAAHSGVCADRNPLSRGNDRVSGDEHRASVAVLGLDSEASVEWSIDVSVRIDHKRDSERGERRVFHRLYRSTSLPAFPKEIQVAPDLRPARVSGGNWTENESLRSSP